MPPLQTDVLVIGGGATGAGVAWDCALRGFDTILAERRDLGEGTSGRFHGLLHSGGRYAVKDPDAAIECIEENVILRRIAADCIEDTGGLFVTTPDDDPAYGDEFLAGCARTGVPAEEISVAEALRMEPRLNPGIRRAFTVFSLGLLFAVGTTPGGLWRELVLAAVKFPAQTWREPELPPGWSLFVGLLLVPIGLILRSRKNGTAFAALRAAVALHTLARCALRHGFVEFHEAGWQRPLAPARFNVALAQQHPIAENRDRAHHVQRILVMDRVAGRADGARLGVAVVRNAIDHGHAAVLAVLDGNAQDHREG